MAQENSNEAQVPSSTGEVNRNSGEVVSQKNWVTYVLGLFLAFCICLTMGGVMLSNDFFIALQVGSIMGLGFFLVVGPVHLLLQMVAHFIMVRVKRPLRWRTQAIVFNIPAMAIWTFLLVGAALSARPTAVRAAVQRHFNNALPASAFIKSYRWDRGLNEGQATLVFSIRPSDLEQLLVSEGYVPMRGDAKEMAIFKRHHSFATHKLPKGAFDFASAETFYATKTNIGTCRISRELIVGSNRVDVLFLESFY